MEKLESAINMLSAQIDKKNEELKVCNNKMAVLAKEAKVLKIRIDERIFKLNLLKDYAVLMKGVPKEVQELRTHILKLQVDLPREDITILYKKNLDADIKRLKVELIKQCKHSFLVYYDSYAGSYSDDYNDAHHGKRMCVVCSFSEYSKGTRGDDVFPSLNDSLDRLVIRNDGFADRPQPTRKPLNIWRPLEDVLKIYIDKRVYEILKTF
jgi:hypothetical protein